MKNKFPKISVIIPVYNVEKYLTGCLDSIIIQSLKDIEIICVNDGSLDKSGKILQQYSKSDSRIKVINQSNKGLSGARNTGLKHAVGKYIFFLDSDDRILPETLECLYGKTGNNIDLVIGNASCFYIDKKPSNFDRTINYFNIKKTTGIYSADKFLSFSTVAWGRLYKKSIIDKFNLQFDEGLINEDNAWHWYYCVRMSNIFFYNEPFYQYLIREDSIMGKKYKDNKYLDVIKIYENIYLYLKKNNLHKKYHKDFSKIFLTEIWNVINHAKSKNKKEIEKFCIDAGKRCHVSIYKRKLLQNIFSIRNEYSDDIKIKVLSIFWIKIVLRNKGGK